MQRHLARLLRNRGHILVSMLSDIVCASVRCIMELAMRIVPYTQYLYNLLLVHCKLWHFS